MNLSKALTLAALTLAGAAPAQNPEFRIDIRTDPGQMVWIAMGQRLGPTTQFPGVSGSLRLDLASTIIWAAAPAGPLGKSRNPVPAAAFRAGLRWNAQLVALEPQGLRLTPSFTVDGVGLPQLASASPTGMPVGGENPDGNDDPRQAAVNHSLANGNTSFDLDARRNPTPPPREAGRRGALASAGSEPLIDMGGLERVDLANMTAFPYSASVKLFMTFPGTPNKYYQGSGILIDPDHVLTAGHCAYDKDLGGYADKIWVIPGYSATGASTGTPWNTDMSNWGGSEPFGHSSVVDIKTWSEWRNNKKYKHDLAVVELNRPVGALAGWIGIDYSNSCSFYKDNYFYMRGYPATGPYVGSRMYAQSGDFDSCPTKWEARFDRLSYGGSSGSGFYDYDNGDRWVHGVLSHAAGLYPNKTDAVRMRDEKYDDIRDWMNDHRGTSADLTPLAARFNDAVFSTPPSSVTRGSSYALEFTCLNYSRVSRSGSLTYTWRISSNDTISGGDTVLDTVTKSSVPIGSLETLDLHDTLTIPSSLSTGTWYIGVIISTTDARTGNQHTLAQDVLQVSVI